MAPAPEKCPGCAARIPASRPPFCEYCGATLPPGDSPTVEAKSAEFERRLAALRAEEQAAPPRERSSGMLIAVVVVAGIVLALGSCALLGVRGVPPH